MNPEQNAKAYEMALEAARKELGVDRKEWEVVQQVLCNIFPELAKSDDERIMEELIGALMWQRDCLDAKGPHDNKLILPGFTMKVGDILEWLEKQKEHLPIPDKFSGLKSLMLQYLQSAANRKDDTEIESDTDLWGRKILDYVWKYSDEQKEQKPAESRKRNKPKESWLSNAKYEIEHADELLIQKQEELREIRELKQKEQKPVEKQDYSGLNDLERAIHRGFLTAGMDNVPVTVIKETAKECLAQMKPAEWSEEDDWKRKELIQYLEEKGDYRTVWMTWLKSLRPQSKQEWSEEDEETIGTLINYFEGDALDYSADEMIRRIKALRPQQKNVNNMITPNKEFFQWIYNRLVYVHNENPDMDYMRSFKERIEELSFDKPSWKPSKEQMEALEYVIRDYREDCCNATANYLQEVLDHLKNM